MSVKIKQTIVETLPTGEYPVRIAEIKLETGQFGDQLRFRFDVMAPGFEDRNLTGWASATFSNKSKLYQWTKAAFGGVEIPREWTFDSDKLIGRECIAVVLVRTADDGSEFNKIDALKPARNGAARAPRPAPVNVTPVLAPAEAPPWLNTAGDGVDDLPF